MDQLAKEAAVEAKTTKVQRPVYSTTVLMGFYTKTDAQGEVPRSGSLI